MINQEYINDIHQSKSWYSDKIQDSLSLFQRYI